MEPVRVYVGADRSQFLAVKVLEHSIKRHTALEVRVTPMLDLPVPEPKDPKNRQRTGFSFSRFCIPKLAGYSGRAIYMDADMLVFRDIASLWNIPFDSAKVIVQREVKHQQQSTAKVGAPSERPKQCSVMLLDCDQLDWDIDRIVAGFDVGRYDYGMLMYQLCILEESEIKFGVPFEWNSLEHYDKSTHLLHYTDVYTQPWTSTLNANGYLWFNEVRMMLEDGSLSMHELKQEVDLGFFRPSLLRDIRFGHRIPRFARAAFNRANAAFDSRMGFKPHKKVYEAKKLRVQAEKDQQTAAATAPEKSAMNPAAQALFDEVYLSKVSADSQSMFVLTENLSATYALSFATVAPVLASRGNVSTYVLTQNSVRQRFSSARQCFDQILKVARPSVAVFSRVSSTDGLELMDLFRRSGIPVVYHIDDNLLEIPQALASDVLRAHANGQVVERRRRMLGRADLIYCSTERLKQRMSELFPESMCVHGLCTPYLGNAATDASSADVNDSGQVLIGYMGSKGHVLDLAFITPAIERVLDANPKYRFEIFGTVPVPQFSKHLQGRLRVHSPIAKYSDFLSHLRNLRWTVGLAPLQRTPFNNCKTPVKFLEYSAAGIPTIASNAEVYAEIIDSSNGLLACSVDEWVAHIDRLTKDAAVRQELVRCAVRTCEAQFALDKVLQGIESMMQNARVRARANGTVLQSESA